MCSPLLPEEISVLENHFHHVQQIPKKLLGNTLFSGAPLSYYQQAKIQIRSVSFTYVFKYYYVNALIFIGDFRSFSDLFGSPSSQLNCGKWLHQCNFNSWITSNALRPWKLQSLFNEIKPFSSCFQVVFSYVIRSANSKADALAKAGGGEG